MKIIHKSKHYLKKLKDLLTNASISIGYKLYDRIITPKKNIKDLSIKNYATINIEKEYKYRKINDLGTLVLDFFQRLVAIYENEYKIKQAQIDLNILNQEHIKSLKDMQKMMLKYPKFINQSLNRYTYLIKRTNFANKDINIEPVLEINGDNTGIIFIIDSYHLKVPLSLYYSLINRENQNKILGLMVDSKDLNYLKNHENSYNIINIHLSYLLTINDEVFESKIKQLIKLEAQILTYFLMTIILPEKAIQ